MGVESRSDRNGLVDPEGFEGLEAALLALDTSVAQRRAALPPSRSGATAAEPPGPLLEYLYSSSQTSLSLDELLEYQEEISDPEFWTTSPWPERCPNVKGKVLVVRGYPLGNKYGGEILYKGTVLNIRCNRWDCKSCAKHKVALIQARASVGTLVKETDRLLKLGYKYPVKMFHLTLPGKTWRKEHTIVEAVEMLRKNQNKLFAALRKRYGAFHYLCTVEPHKDGWPHMHFLLVSETIASTKPLGFVKHLWWQKYGMGFVKVTVKIKQWDKQKKCYEKHLIKDALPAIRYATKYMWKGLDNFGDHKKLISCSKGVLAKKSDLFVDHGFPVFIQVCRESSDDKCLDYHNRHMDSYELFSTKSVAELESIRDRLGGGVFACRVKGETYQALKEEFPDAMLPEVYTRKCPTCRLSVRHCKCGNCTKCGLPRSGGDKGCQCHGQ